MISFEQRLARLRGQLPHEEVGARGIEHAARNPPCLLLQALTLAGIAPATALRTVHGESVREGASPFAFQAGRAFERAILDDGAHRLLALYRAAGRLRTDECKLVDVALEAGDGPMALDRRRAITLQLLDWKHRSDHRAPNLLIKPRLHLTILGVAHPIEPDLLVAADGDVFYTATEIKSYAHRQGKTDAAALRGACRQLAVYVVALRQEWTRLCGLPSDSVMPAIGDLVLRRPGSFWPLLDRLPLDSEIQTLERLIDTAPSTLDIVERVLGGRTLDSPGPLDALPRSYRASCLEHCALAPRCKSQAIQAADPAILGDSARLDFAPAPSLTRVAELLDGRGPLPQDDDERQLQTWLESYRGIAQEAGNVR